MGWPRWLVHRTAQMFLVCVFTTMLLAMFLNHSQIDMQQTMVARRQKMEYVERIRLEKLHAYQKEIFVNLKRPGDNTYNINISRSESLPLDREIIDPRPAACKEIVYDIDDLPAITIIIPFYNEALSLLLRTVHSILNRTPPKLLSQIILVNDHSLNEDLFEPLEKYVKLLPDKVKLIRTKRREGLIRARLIGAEMAIGPVIMFQDAHTENNVGWAEPILTEIKRNRKVLIQPTIDQIDAKSIEYIPASNTVPRGGFSWDLRYTWMEMPEHEKNRLQSTAQPFRTPTLVGCAFAVDKDYFFEFGGFDDAFNIWGGENIEIAWRGWMCGGEVLTHPCSHVAHTFKPFAFKFDGDREKIVQKNLMRTAELWMDDYKKFFYASTYSWETKRTYFTEQDWASLEKRLELKRELGCKGFDWYMKTIFPEVPRPEDDAVYYGEVANEKSEACWYMTADDYVGLTYFCFFHRVLPENLFRIDTQQRLVYRDKCIRVDRKTWLLKVGPCQHDGEERWDVEHFGPVRGLIRARIRHTNGDETTMCVLQVTNVNQPHNREQMPQLTGCDNTKEFMYWRWTYKFDFKYSFEKPF